jgi:hypothetical protein
MSDFDPFKNDSQVITLTSGDDEFSLENAPDSIVLSGTLTLGIADADSRANALLLRDTLSRILSSFKTS